ncbi:ATP-binding protein [Mesorhizobium sp. Z1-4]|uniref:sensor histidine kinase n=1 Tax=Mesorhizobium sp. Z1-4 TaxID=2448478 RepID=UPI000FDB6309|nr:ATP-binding protein [Mesorhizobium sp. Z1-4]
MSRNATLQKPLLQVAAFLGLAVVLGAVTILVAMRLAERSAEAELRRNAEFTLGLQVETILSHLDKYRHVPALTARRQDVLAMLADGLSAADADELRVIASNVRTLSGATDSAFAAPDGMSMTSATGYLTPDLIADTELVRAALQGRLGRASLSAADTQHTYAFSTGVRLGRDVRAIIIVAAPLDSIEQTWALSPNPIVAFDSRGQLVAGNRMARGRASAIREAVFTGAGASAGTITLPDTGSSRFIPFRRYIPHMDWTLFVLVPDRAIVDAGRYAATVAGLGAALATLIGVIIVLSLQESRRRHRLERLTALRLERQVRQRTGELSRSNARLAVEVEERKLTETALRKAQTELVQSTKLAAIGQMSAALAHEYNQPLAAIRSYADNAQLFLARKKTAQVSDNLSRIGAMVDRMATLSKTLKSFARKPRIDLADVQLEQVLQDSLLLIQPKAKAAGMKIVCRPDRPGRLVRAGPVRLAQVFVNLISNAIDSNTLSGADEITIDWQADDTTTTIRVCDRGPGISADDVHSIFDPFFTTKEVGEGLGLGLSIAYNIVQDFGGKLSAGGREGGGATFTVVLRTAAPAKNRQMEPA